MPGRFKYETLSQYPHLAPNDRAIWERFMVAFQDAYESVDYDLHVGEGAEAPLDTPPDQYTENHRQLTQKRIDVTGYKKNGTVDSIEVRPNAGSSAIGSSVVNAILLRKLLPRTDVKAVIITDHAQADIISIAAGVGIEIIQMDVVERTNEAKINK